MTLFVDTHKGAQLSSEMRRDLERKIRSGTPDRFGVSDRGILIDVEKDEMHCVLEGPSVQAVVEHHKAVNVPVDQHTIHRADAILR